MRLVTYLEVEWLPWSFLLLHALILLLHAWILWLHEAWLMIFIVFPCAGVLWSDLSCMQLFSRSDLHLQAVAVAWSQNQNLFLPLLSNGNPDWAETRWACSYHHYASPIAKSWSMDARISRKMETCWIFQRSISRKPCIRIGWNCSDMFSSPFYNSPQNGLSNGCMVFKLWQKQILF